MIAGKVLVVYDDQFFANQIKKELNSKGYSVSMAFSAAAALEDLRSVRFDLVISKFGMPDMHSKEFITQMKKVDPDVIIVVILAELNPQVAKEALSLGIYEIMVKPINLEKLFFITKKGIELRYVLTGNRKLLQSTEEKKIALERQNKILSKRIEELSKSSTKLYENLHTTYMRTIKALAQTIDARDHYTHSHSENVAKVAAKIAEAMGLPVRQIEMISQACELHDIGKISIHDQILNKESGLTPAEREAIKLHSLKGAEILEPLNFLQEVTRLVCEHHEHYDGSGYPYGHKGDEIPLGARIIHVADAYDAMTSARAYRKIPLTKEEAVVEIRKNTGTQFDPAVVEAFISIVGEL